MREIKFRAWDNRLNVISYFGLESAGNYHECMDNPLMQYTGLKDKNGTEIYEGDILDAKYKWTVIFTNGAFWLKSDKAGNDGLLYSIRQARHRAGVELEVIGNIHENPELVNS